jgi:hypothetical protein
MKMTGHFDPDATSWPCSSIPRNSAELDVERQGCVCALPLSSNASAEANVRLSMPWTLRQVFRSEAMLLAVFPETDVNDRIDDEFILGIADADDGADLHGKPGLVVFLIGIAIVVLASEFGWRLGARTEGHAASGNISALEQSLLGLLALIVGFTFLMALTRFEARREAVLNEANAIGTTALRARLLPEPHRTESLKLLREYAQIRIDYIPTGKSFAELPTLIERSNNIQEALWQQVKALSAKDNNMVPTGLFIQALNEMIDNQGKRLSALRNHIPDVVLLSLFGIAAVACGFAGYASGLDPLRTRLPVFITAFLVCSVIFVILDLDRPNVGFITISQQPMIDTVASLSAFNE